MHARRVRRQGLPWVGHRREILVVHVHQACRRVSRLLGLGHHQRHFIATEAHHVAAQYRLVGNDQAKGVERHICRGEHRDHAGMREGRAGIQRADPGMRAVGVDHFEAQHARTHKVGRVARLTGDFGQRIWPWDGGADHAS